MIVGKPAEQHVKAILKPGESLEKVSVWADCAKGYCGALTPDMRTAVAANPKHHDYHFTNIPFQASKYEDGAVGTTDHDVVQTIKQSISVLQGRTDLASNPHGFTQREALLLLAHFVGDIHQPMHVGTAYMDGNDDFTIPKTQADINNVGVFETHGDNYLLLGSKPLHGYWDREAVVYAMRRAKVSTPAEFATYLLSKPTNISRNTGNPTDWPRQWADEALSVSKLAHDGLVPGEREEAQDRNGRPHYAWTVTSPRDYAKRVSTLAAKHVTAAGVRLAHLLEVIWP